MRVGGGALRFLAGTIFDGGGCIGCALAGRDEHARAAAAAGDGDVRLWSGGRRVRVGGGPAGADGGRAGEMGRAGEEGRLGGGGRAGDEGAVTRGGGGGGRNEWVGVLEGCLVTIVWDKGAGYWRSGLNRLRRRKI